MADVLDLGQALEMVMRQVSGGTATLPDALVQMWNLGRRAEQYDAAMMRRAEPAARSLSRPAPAKKGARR